MTQRDAGRRVFLTAEWRSLAILNFQIDAAVLRPLVPAGTELDTWRGDALVSLVGFRFLDTRIAGVRVPFHRSFDEVNLRFYVRRVAGPDVRRGVTFIREIVARRAVAWLARLAYNEPYVTLPMRSTVPSPGALEPGRVEYTWRSARGWNRLAVDADGAPGSIAPGSEAEFTTEHYWGYTRQADGSTLEYEVAHPRWRTWTVKRFDVDGDVAALGGAGFGEALAAPPCSALLAEGSPVTVFRPRRLLVRAGG